MKSFLRFALAACVLFLASLTGCILSAEQVPQRPVLRAVYGDFYPYSFTAQDGSAQGYSVDVTRQLVQSAGYDVRFIAAETPSQILEMLERGEIDLTPFLALTPERQSVGLATSSLGEYVLSVYVRRDREIENIQSLSTQRIGVVVGADTRAAAQAIPLTVIVEYQTADQMILPLMTGEIDAVVAVAETFEARLRANFMEDKLRRLEQKLAIIPYGLIVRRDLQGVHAALEEAIRQTATPDLLASLRAHWFGNDRSIVEHPWFTSVVMIIGGISLAMLALTIYAMRLRYSSALLLVEHGENQLLIDALDKIRGAVAIFDSDMNAVHWNDGFEARFAQIVPVLRNKESVEHTILYAYQNGIFKTELSTAELQLSTKRTIQKLRNGSTVQRLVETQQGNTFDLSMFRLGSRHYAAIWVDVTELHRQQEHIAAQSRELAQKNQQLLAFSTMAAHDLKAPLVQQTMLIDIIQEDLAEAQIVVPYEVESYFSTLRDLSERMNVLVRDLLSLAKADIDRGDAECFVPNTRLDGILKLSGIGSHIELVVMPDMPAIHVAPNSFDLVMRNLISNAVKHNDQHTGRITLRAQRSSNEVVFEIEDNGPGITDAQRQRVFEPFCRLTKVEGTGLGLAFVKKTVESWGGSIHLRSAPQRGCLFEVRCPAASGRVIALPPVQKNVVGSDQDNANRA